MLEGGEAANALRQCLEGHAAGRVEATERPQAADGIRESGQGPADSGFSLEGTRKDIKDAFKGILDIGRYRVDSFEEVGL